MKQAVILFTRVPLPGQAKTRLMPFLTGQEAAGLQTAFIRDILDKGHKIEADYLIFYTPQDEQGLLQEIAGSGYAYIPQSEGDLGERMKRAIAETLALGYERVLLIGSDTPQLSTQTLTDAFAGLDSFDVVINPTLDGGYCLIGMKQNHDEIWKIPQYGNESVIRNQLHRIEAKGLRAMTGDIYYDIDREEDLRRLHAEMTAGKIPDCRHTKSYLREQLAHKL